MAWLTERGSRRQAESRQRFEHLRDQRTPRREVYTDLIEKVDLFIAQLPQTDGAWRAGRDEIRRAVTRVLLEGPESVLEPARRIEVQVAVVWIAGSVANGDHPTEDEFSGRALRAADQLKQDREDFITAARRVLDESGS